MTEFFGFAFVENDTTPSASIDRDDTRSLHYAVAFAPASVGMTEFILGFWTFAFPFVAVAFGRDAGSRMMTIRRR
jgi:hypothetical protein